MTTVDVRRCTDPTMAEPVAVMLDLMLGKGLHDPADVADDMTSSSSVVVTATADGRLVGAATGRILDADDRLVELLADAGETVDGSVGLLESTAVDPQWRGQHIGLRLAAERMTILGDMGAVAITALSWESGQKGRSRPVLERLGFQVVRPVERPWDGSSCPVCGNCCACDGSLMLYRATTERLADRRPAPPGQRPSPPG